MQLNIRDYHPKAKEADTALGTEIELMYVKHTTISSLTFAIVSVVTALAIGTERALLWRPAATNQHGCAL